MTKIIEKHRRSIPSLLFLFVSFTCMAQVSRISQVDNIPQGGDCIKKELLPYIYEGESGDNQIWDFSNLSPTGRLVLSYAEQGDTLFCTDDDGISYYNVDENGLWLSGYKNELEQMDYSQGLLLLRYPLSYGERHTDIFEGEGRYCESHYMRHGGTRQIKADGTGILILPEGDTLRNTLRVNIITTA